MWHTTQPAIHTRLLPQKARRQGSNAQLQKQSLETGGEDLPVAYRWVPSDPEQRSFSVVGVEAASLGPVAPSSSMAECSGRQPQSAGGDGPAMAVVADVDVLRRCVVVRHQRRQRAGPASNEEDV